MKTTNNQQQPEDQNFEKELYNALKYHGFLFPKTEKDVERFEHLNGSTEIQLPEHLDSPDFVFERNQFLPDDVNSSEILQNAAFYDTNYEPLESYDDLIKQLGKSDQKEDNEAI